MSDDTFEGRLQQHLRLEDLSDMAVLEALVDCSDETRTASSGDIAERLQIHARRPRQMVGARMSWLRRMGFVDRDEETGRWGLSKEGEELYKGRNLTQRQQEQLHKLLDGRLAGATALLSAQMQSGDDTQYNAMRRQIRHAELRRKKGVR